jgi:thymidine kinase
MKKGSLTVITGPMFAGKTEELLRLIRRTQYAHKPHLVFKPHLDNRNTSGAKINSHQNNQNEAIIITHSQEIKNHLTPLIEVIFIDEIQFLDTGIIKLLNNLASQNLEIVVAGLDKNFRGEPFNEVIKTLLTQADQVIKLTAICQFCKKEATFSQRIINGQPARYDDPLILVGGEEKYEARCRQCHVIVGLPHFEEKI